MQLRVLLVALAVWASSSPAVARPAGRADTGKAGGEDFFIVSSVDLRKKQVVLKHPTEVTELAAVTEKTAFLDEKGQPLRLRDFRAGDTIHVSFGASRDGIRTISRIQKGPMTLEELHRRYLDFK